MEGTGGDGGGEEVEGLQTKEEVSITFCRAAANVCKAQLLALSASNRSRFDHAVGSIQVVNICAIQK